MGIIHLINGQDGGVGKSTTAKIIADYCIDKKIPIKLFDADRKEDVYRIYKDKYPVETAIFNEGEDYQDAANTIYDAGVNNNVLVNLPANVFHSLSDWFDKNGIFATAEEMDVHFYNWFVTDGDPDKVINLQQNLNFFGDECSKNILVKNYGKRKDWSDFNSDKLIKKLVKSYSLIVLELPKLLGNTEKDIISREFLTFTEAKAYRGFSSSISNSRIRSFVRTSFKMLDNSKIFDANEKTASEKSISSIIKNNKDNDTTKSSIQKAVAINTNSSLNCKTIDTASSKNY